MKTTAIAWFVTLILIVCVSPVAAQINWIEHDIDASFDGAWGITVADLDIDGDMDVVGCSKDADDVAWYENDGSQNFTKHIIDPDFQGGRCVVVSDIDSDGDMDVVGAGEGYSYDGIISWWENDGAQNFTEHLIIDFFENAYAVDAVDIDGDNDIDLLGVSNWGHEVSWWENDGNRGFTQHWVASNFRYPYSVAGVDLDRDGDMDVVAGAAYEEVSWFENIGDQVFIRHMISHVDSCFATSLDLVDFDGDNDLDILTNDLWHHKVYCFVNDGTQNFSLQTVDEYFYGCWNIKSADIDNDGDLDVAGAAWRDSAITWWENLGNFSFERHDLTRNFSKARAAVPADLDNDGDVDIVAAAERADKITWWESDFATGLNDNIGLNLPGKPLISSIYPNPFNAFTVITYDLPEDSYIRIGLYDILGREVIVVADGLAKAGEHNVHLDASQLPSSVYFIALRSGDHVDSRKAVLLK